MLISTADDGILLVLSCTMMKPRCSSVTLQAPRPLLPDATRPTPTSPVGVCSLHPTHWGTLLEKQATAAGRPGHQPCPEKQPRCCTERKLPCRINPEPLLHHVTTTMHTATTTMRIAKHQGAAWNAQTMQTAYSNASRQCAASVKLHLPGCCTDAAMTGTCLPTPIA